MRKTRIVAAILLLTAMTVPALAAWNIPKDTTSMPAMTTPRPPRSWTATLQRAMPAGSAEVRANAVSAVVATDRSAALSNLAANRPTFVKSAEDMKIMRPIITGQNPAFSNSVVPEPGSIAGLSAGLLGLIFQVRRSRRRS